MELRSDLPTRYGDASGVKPTGWGTWIRFSNVTVANGDLTIRSPWIPGDVTAAERADETRLRSVPRED